LMAVKIFSVPLPLLKETLASRFLLSCFFFS
jgi:hypothetical protein